MTVTKTWLDIRIAVTLISILLSPKRAFIGLHKMHVIYNPGECFLASNSLSQIPIIERILTFSWRQQNNICTIGQYHACSYPSPVCHQVISSHDTHLIYEAIVVCPQDEFEQIVPDQCHGIIWIFDFLWSTSVLEELKLHGYDIHYIYGQGSLISLYVKCKILTILSSPQCANS